MKDFEYKTDSNGSKYVVWMEDLDIIVLSEGQVKEFIIEFKAMEREKSNETTKQSK